MSAPGAKPETTADGRPVPSKLVAVHRWIVTKNKCYHLKVQGHNTRPKDADAFFDNFTLAKRSRPPQGKDGGAARPNPSSRRNRLPPRPGGPRTSPRGRVQDGHADRRQDHRRDDQAPVEAGATHAPVGDTLPAATDADGVVYEVRGAVLLGGGERGRPDQRDTRCRECTVYEKLVRLGGAPKPVTWSGKPAFGGPTGPGRGGPRDARHRRPADSRPRFYAQQGKPDPEKVRVFLDSFEFTN